MTSERQWTLDLIYDSVDELMRQGEFQQLDALLAGLPVAEMSVDVLLGYLTASLPARSRLPSRNALYAKTEQTLKERGELEAGLLHGLE